MELFQLKCVLAVAKHKNFTRAAADINISQSALSQQISKLEHELGTSLFYRTTREVELLSTGSDFVAYASDIVDKCEALKRRMEEYVEKDHGFISIGGMPVIRTYNITSMIASFIRSYKDIAVEFNEAECFDLIELLKNRKIDVAIVHSITSCDSVTFEELLYDEFSLVINSTHPLASRREIQLENLKNETFVLPSKDSASCQEFIRACNGVGFTPNILSKCGSVNTIVDFVRENLGIAVLSYRVACVHSDPTISIVKINPPINRYISLATIRNAQRTPVVRTFINYATQWASNEMVVSK